VLVVVAVATALSGHQGARCDGVQAKRKAMQVASPYAGQLVRGSSS